MPARYATLQRVRSSLDAFMLHKLKMKAESRAMAFYYWQQLQEQILAVLPITACLVATMGIFFQHQVDEPGKLAGGLVSAIFGLFLFMDGLRVAIMPLGDVLGHWLPQRFKVRVILLISCMLGILVTYAEPAIASLRPLADLVQRCDTPYLFFVLNDMQEILVLTIGLGVGVAAMVGVLRFLRGWSLKPLIALSLSPTIACACYMKWGNPDLAPLIGLAWDCGAVTTGPVTVPILLSLGIGVMKGQKAREETRQILAEKSAKNQGKALEGFGVVTLASTFPVLAVEILSIVLSFRYTRDEIRYDFGRSNCSSTAVKTVTAVSDDATLVRDAIIFALRSILPLNVFLILMITVVLQKDLPKISFAVPIPPDLLPDEGDSREAAQDRTASASHRLSAASALSDLDNEGDPEFSHRTDEEKAARKKLRQDRKHKVARAVTAVSAPEAKLNKRQTSMDCQRRDLPLPEPAAARGSLWQRVSKEGPLLLGILESQLGMMLFNIGLTYGFTALGNQSGMVLPAAFLKTDDFPGSPVYGFAGGVTIVMVTLFCLGFLATRAEPALRVMGRTVETLSEGRFSTSMLIYTVCVGVASGMVAGSAKILFGVNIIYLILAKYAFASAITVISSEDFTNIAWDSAGVTTGPVTVPFVLSVGIGFSKAVNAPEGFGILTCASVAPIITVLSVDLLRQWYGRTLDYYNRRRLAGLRSKGVQCSPEDLMGLLADGDAPADGGDGRKALRDVQDASTQYEEHPAAAAAAAAARGVAAHDVTVAVDCGGDGFAGGPPASPAAADIEMTTTAMRFGDA